MSDRTSTGSLPADPVSARMFVDLKSVDVIVDAKMELQAQPLTGVSCSLAVTITVALRSELAAHLPL